MKKIGWLGMLLLGGAVLWWSQEPANEWRGQQAIAMEAHSQLQLSVPKVVPLTNLASLQGNWLQSTITADLQILPTEPHNQPANPQSQPPTFDSPTQQSQPQPQPQLPQQQPQAPAQPRPQSHSAAYPLLTVEGVALTDTKAELLELLGAPARIEQDSYTPEFAIYHYGNLQIGMSVEGIRFVRVLSTAGTIRIDGRSMPMTLEAIQAELGQPDFIAEDGLVYKRPQTALKLFFDMETQRLRSVDLFHRSGE
ncbi:hypothetical protein [Paenibacillus koleovorans]|uniref:hypothetical protein n=1 Tax=Paenibacillus koleovorans TaxID=121608 RepID=UPI000FDBDD85|nr:hypothetical protein [Paenibacillus koleovorans]